GAPQELEAEEHANADQDGRDGLADEGWPGDGVILVLDDLVLAEGALQLFELFGAVELLRRGLPVLVLCIGPPRGSGGPGCTGGGSSCCDPGTGALVLSVLAISALGRRLRIRSVLCRRSLRGLGALCLIRGDLRDQGRLLGGGLGVLLRWRSLIGDSRDLGGLFFRTLRRDLAAVNDGGASGSRGLWLRLLLFSLLGRALLGLVFGSLLRRSLFLCGLLCSGLLGPLGLLGLNLLCLFGFSLLGLLFGRLLCGSLLGGLSLLSLFDLLGLLDPGLSPIRRGPLTLVITRPGRGGSFALGVLDD